MEEKLRLYRVEERKNGLTDKGYFLASFPLSSRGKNNAEYKPIPRYKVIRETEDGVWVEFAGENGRQRAMAMLLG